MATYITKSTYFHILMPKTSAPNMTKHITTSQYGGPLPNHMPKPNMQIKTTCPNIICYNQILIFSFRVVRRQYGQTYSHYSRNIPNSPIIYFYFNPTGPYQFNAAAITIRFHKWHTFLVRSRPSCHVSDSNIPLVSHLCSRLSSGCICCNCDRCPYVVRNSLRKLPPHTCFRP